MRNCLIIMFVFALAGCASINETPKGLEQTNQKQSRPDSFIDYCNEAPCRRNVIIHLMQKDGTIFEYESKLDPPVIQPSFISIYAGETIFIEADEGEHSPINLIHVSENTKPEKTIVYKFEQRADMGNGYDMVLTVHNPFSKPLRYNMGIMPLESDRLYKTSSCPVMAKGDCFEHWPFPIFQIAVANMRFLEKGDDFSCRE